MCDSEGYFTFCDSCTVRCCKLSEHPRLPLGLTKKERVYFTKYYGIKDYYYIPNGKNYIIYFGKPEDVECGFLSEAGCLLGDEKPLACKLFPFGLVQREDSYFLIQWLGECPDFNPHSLDNLDWVTDTLIAFRHELCLNDSLLSNVRNVEYIKKLTVENSMDAGNDCEIFNHYKNYSYCKAPLLTLSEVGDYSYCIAEESAITYFTDAGVYALSCRKDVCPLSVNGECSLDGDRPVLCLCFPYFVVCKQNKYYIAKWVLYGKTYTDDVLRSEISLLQKYKTELSLNYKDLSKNSFSIVKRL